MTAFIISVGGLLATGFGPQHAVLVDMLSDISGEFIYFCFPLLFSAPIMAVAVGLLYFGGRAARLRRTRARMMVGLEMAILGLLLWVAVVYRPYLTWLL